MTIFRSSVILLVVSLSLGAYEAADQEPDPHDQVCRADLERAGVSPKSESALVGALASPDGHLAFCAVSSLGDFPGSPFIDNGLLLYVRSVHSGPAMQAAIALLVIHRNTLWVDEVAKLLPSMQDPIDLLRVSGSLAKMGRYDGWPYVADFIARSSSDPILVEEALWSVRDYKGMKDSKGVEVNLSQEMDKMQLRATPQRRSAIIKAMSYLAPPKPADKGSRIPQ